MTDDSISCVAIIGTGQMGPTIAVATTLAGCPTTLIGRSAQFKASKQERSGVQVRSHGAIVFGMGDGLCGVANQASSVAAIERHATYTARRAQPSGRSPYQARTLAALPLATGRLAPTHVPML